MVLYENKTQCEYRFFCRNFQDMITLEACMARRNEALASGCRSCTGCSKDTLMTKTSRGMSRFARLKA